LTNAKKCATILGWRAGETRVRIKRDICRAS